MLSDDVCGVPAKTMCLKPEQLVERKTTQGGGSSRGPAILLWMCSTLQAKDCRTLACASNGRGTPHIGVREARAVMIGPSSWAHLLWRSEIHFAPPGVVEPCSRKSRGPHCTGHGAMNPRLRSGLVHQGQLRYFLGSLFLVILAGWKTRGF